MSHSVSSHVTLSPLDEFTVKSSYGTLGSSSPSNARIELLIVWTNLPDFDRRIQNYSDRYPIGLMDISSPDFDVALLVLKLFVSFMCLLGIVGNVIAFIVLRSYRNKTSMDRMLMYLAVVDIGLLALVIAALIEKLTTQSVLTVTSSYFLILFLHFQMMSIFAVVYLSIDRYMAVCRPFLGVEFCSKRQARIAMVTITVFTIVFYMYKWIHRLFGEQLGRKLEKYDEFIWVMEVFIDGLMVYVIPLIVLFTLNIRLILAIRKVARSAARMTPGSALPSSIGGAINIVAVVTVFLVTQTVNAVLYLTNRKYPNFTMNDRLRVGVIRYGFVGLNSALNFVVYCAFFSKFREHLSVMCGRKKTVPGYDLNGIPKSDYGCGTQVEVNNSTK